MDRGRSAVGPVVDEIVANLSRHKMILGTGAGTRARHVYSLAIDLGLPTGVLTVLGTAVAWQNAQMLQYLLAKHGIAFLEPEGFALFSASIHLVTRANISTTISIRSPRLPIRYRASRL